MRRTRSSLAQRDIVHTLGVCAIALFTTLSVPSCTELAGPAKTDTLRLVDTVTKIVVATDTLVLTHTDTVPKTDTLVRRDTVVHVDTLIRTDSVTRTDTVTHTDTLIRSDTLIRTDTLVRVDTVATTHTDTLYVPSAAVHDTAWIYLQASPSNPFGGGVGDGTASLVYLTVYDGFSIVFWHGLFVGVVSIQNDGTAWAWEYIPGQMEMPLNSTAAWPTFLAAVRSLAPVQLTLADLRPQRYILKR